MDSERVREEGYRMLHTCLHINKHHLCCLATKHFSLLASYSIIWFQEALSLKGSDMCGLPALAHTSKDLALSEYVHIN